MKAVRQNIQRIVLSLVSIAALSLLGYFGFPAIGEYLDQVTFRPCQKPMAYEFGPVDTRFHLTTAELRSAVSEAEDIWEKAAKKELFEEHSPGTLSIALVYDERQAATDKLKSLGIDIKTDQATYDKLKIQYESKQADYNQKLKALNEQTADFDRRKADYEKKVADWNSRGGAPKPVYEELQQEETALRDSLKQINAQASAVNALVEEINALASTLNRLARDLNLQVGQYNSVGKSGEEFDEGVYSGNGREGTITIFQFTDRDKLVRVLAHELGHALGLGHVEDPKAIMYRLNQSLNSQPTAADLTELQRVCGATKTNNK